MKSSFVTKFENIGDQDTTVDKHNQTGMTWFRAFRSDFGFSYYGEHRTSVTADIPFAAIIYTCVLLSIAALVAAAGIRGKERWYTLVRLVYTLAVGSIILVSLFGYCWQTGDVRVHTPYIYRSDGHIDGSIGVRIGLKTVNLTLSGTFADEISGSFNYNEELLLSDVLSHSSQLWEALERGLPQPLLSILEQFDVDEGNLRYSRSCFLAGHFANILLWTAFAFWVTANILLCSVVWYGAGCFTLTGVCMILASIVYDMLCPQNQVKMPCSEGTLQLRYGWCFWSTLVFGILTTLIGIILFTLDQKVPKTLAQFFLLDSPQDDIQDEYKQLHASSVPSSHHGTPNSSMRLVNENATGSRTPVNWYINYGLDQNQKGNPVFGETAVDMSCAGHDANNRGFTNIREEDENVSMPGSPEMRHVDNEHQSIDTVNRLNDIYADVEPTHRRNSVNPVDASYIHDLNDLIKTSM